MNSPPLSCPYRVGDLVRFTPSSRTQGLYQAIERFGIKLNEVQRITEIREETYLYFENGAGGWPWNEFTIQNL